MQAFGSLAYDEKTKVPANEPSTFTYTSGDIFNFSSDSEIYQELSIELDGYATVISVNRPFFSGRYVITLVPLAVYTLGEWKQNLRASFYNMGFEDAVFVEANINETVSTQGGGVIQAVQETTNIVTQGIVSPLVKSMWPVLAVTAGGIVAYLITMMPRTRKG